MAQVKSIRYQGNIYDLRDTSKTPQTEHDALETRVDALELLPAQVTQIGSELSDIKKEIGIFTSDLFELGNITINSSGWTYGNNNSRVRTKEGVTLHLYEGDVISLSSYTNARFYLGWLADGTYHSRGWNTADFTVTQEADYVILIGNLTDTLQTSKDALFSLLSITTGLKPSNLKVDLDDVESDLGNVTELETTDKSSAVDAINEVNTTATTNATSISTINSEIIELSKKTGVFVSELFELGDIRITNSGWTYSSNNGRVRPKQGISFHLYVGDTISLSDYTDARFYVGWRLSDGTYKFQGWNTSDFTVTEEADYVFIIGNLADRTQTSKDALFSLLNVSTAISNSRLKESVDAIDLKKVTGVLSPKTTYDSSNYGYTNRVSVFYPLDTTTKRYLVDLSDIVYSNTTLNIRLTSSISPLAGALVRSIGNVFVTTEATVEVTRTDAELTSAKYLAVQANANDAGVSFKSALYLNEGDNMITIKGLIAQSAKNVYGKADFVYDYSATGNTYVTTKKEYNFVNGHEYKVYITYPDGYDGETYCSIRNSANTTLQANILRGTSTRSGTFTSTVDGSSVEGGTYFGITVSAAHDFALSIDCTIIDLSEVSVYSNWELINNAIPDNPTDVISLNGKEYLDNIVEQIARPVKVRSSGGGTENGESQLVLAWCSDIHGDSDNMTRILQFYNTYSSKINDVLCTGDMVYDQWSDDMDWWDEIGADNVIVTIGNHDVKNTNGDAITSLQAYNRYILPYVSNWGVTQPTDAATNGYTYFYKDYTSAKMRLVCLDNMYWDTTQATWLQDVLADAITQGYAVICARHYPFGEEVALDTPFNSIAQYELHWDTPAVLNIIDTFISNGGEFVCWLTGHTHNDFIGTLSAHPNQLVITIANASLNSYWNDTARVSGQKSQDCFNLIAFDYNQKMIKIARIGADYDRLLRHKGTLCYKYDTHTLIFTS